MAHMADAAKRASDAFLDDDFEAAEELFTQVLLVASQRIFAL